MGTYVHNYLQSVLRYAQKLESSEQTLEKIVFKSKRQTDDKENPTLANACVDTGTHSFRSYGWDVAYQLSDENTHDVSFTVHNFALSLQSMNIACKTAAVYCGETGLEGGSSHER
eukprot:1167266_1